MRKVHTIASLIFIFLSHNIYSQKVNQGLKQITPELLKQHIDYLASDSMKGRDTPSPELDLAADYIAKEFEKLGVKRVNGSYFQNITFCTKDLDVTNSQLKISLGDSSKEFNLKTDYTPFEPTANASVDAQIVFAGYGITAPEYNYDDYKDIDVRGKIVLIMKHEPAEKEMNSPFLGDKETAHSYLKTKFENARKHGAVGLLLVTDPLNHVSLSPQGYMWPSLTNFIREEDIPLELCLEVPAIPLAQVGENVIKYLFGSIDSLKHIQMRIDQKNVPQSFLMTNANCQLATKLIVHDVTAKNVVGFIEGRNRKLKNEIVIVGGHYDHIGFMARHRKGEDYIFNGADDNASGTVGVMATAKAFTSMKDKPKRSVLFILFAGEEKGLYGSYYYCIRPLFPLGKTVAMLNMDMISRNGNDSIEVEGEKINPDLAKIVREENESVGLKIVEPKEDLFARSDQFNFFRRDITAIGLTSGLHKDYHTVNDEPQRVNSFKAARITQLVFRTAWFIANDKKHYAIISKKNTIIAN